MSTEFVVAIIGAIFAGIATIVTSIINARKNSKSTESIDKIISDRKTSAINRDEEIKQIREDIATLQANYKSVQEVKDNQSALTNEVGKQNERLAKIEERLGPLEAIPAKLDSLNENLNKNNLDRVRETTEVSTKLDMIMKKLQL